MAAWPKWATVRAEDVRTELPNPDERGPWEERMCARGSPGVFGLENTRHRSEPPHFYHCVPCLKAVRRTAPSSKPWDQRDQGLCVKCGEPAQPNKRVVLLDNAAARQAEALGITIARLSTSKWCVACDPHRLPFCKARNCTTAGKHRGLPPGCCTYTRVGGYRPHCQDVCEAKRRRVAKRDRDRHSKRKSALRLRG